jgi:hypothetical protein
MSPAIATLPTLPKPLDCWRKARCSIWAAKSSCHWIKCNAIESIPESDMSWHGASCCCMRCAAIARERLRYLLVDVFLGDTRMKTWTGPVRAAPVYLGKGYQFARFLLPMAYSLRWMGCPGFPSTTSGGHICRCEQWFIKQPQLATARRRAHEPMWDAEGLEV